MITYSWALVRVVVSLFFFFNDTATTEIYTLSLHDALPISGGAPHRPARARARAHLLRYRQRLCGRRVGADPRDRKSTRLNSSHLVISYAVFCLKKKKRGYTAITERMFEILEVHCGHGLQMR